MTFDREPDLDNANVGMPVTSIGMRKFSESGELPFFCVFLEERMVKVNGEPLQIAGMTLAAYLAGTAYDCGRIAVERNGEIVSKDRYAETVLAAGDCLEIVRFVGGG